MRRYNGRENKQELKKKNLRNRRYCTERSRGEKR